MYQCPNCGGGLKYDIPSAQLHCDHCDSLFSPYDVEKESDGEETEYFEVTRFQCPQCGGEILSTDNAAAGFCSYCGASTILTSRISQERKPQQIIPFQITKEQCKSMFRKKMRKAIFAPKEFKNPDNIQGFRGIYMPYWLYRTEQHNPVRLNGKKSYRQGDYVYTDHFTVTSRVSADYKGFYYDASSSFYDNISKPLAPFNFKKAMDFTPSFFSGFYADAPDVPKEVYEEDALTESVENTFDQMCKHPDLKEISIKDKENCELMRGQLRTKCESIDGVMLPVWFMAYRSGDRVAYAAVNGQTGKIVTDTPVDKKKYIFGSCVLALPIFLILNFLFTIIPSVTLSITTLLAAITSFILYNEMSAIYERENNVEDKGLRWLKGEANVQSQKQVDEVRRVVGIVVAVSFSIFILVPLMYIPAGMQIFCLILSIICQCKARKKFKGLKVKGRHAYILPVLSSIIAGIIYVINPVADMYYYLGAILAIAVVVMVFLSIIGNYNILCMRYLPQFDKKGGDDRA